MTGEPIGEFQRLADEAQTAMGEFHAAATALGTQSVEHESADGTVTATVSLHGRLTDLELRADAMRRTDRFTLAEKIVETVRTAQDRAEARYADEVERITPPAVAEYRRYLAELAERR